MTISLPDPVQESDTPVRISSTKTKTPEYLQPISKPNLLKLPKFCLLQTQEKPQKQLIFPTCWNSKDKSQYIELNPGNTRAIYQGTGKTDFDAACVRANKPVPPECGIYYFEIAVISKGRDGYIAIGFQGSSVPLGRLPGWEDLSWGYHGDDGHSFACSGTGKNYGPVYTTGDVVGCVMNFTHKTVSFTKNGMLLGVAFRDIPTNVNLYPSVGLRTPGEVVEVNFGQKPFRFDIQQYYRDEKMKLWNNIIVQQIQPKSVNDLVLEYLIHSGYHETAKSFYQSTKGAQMLLDKIPHTFEDEPSGSCAQRRQEILNLIFNNQTQSAIEKLQEFYPQTLLDNNLRLSLYCLVYVELLQANGPKSDDQMDVDTNLDEILALGEKMQHEFGSGDQTQQDILNVLYLMIGNTVSDLLPRYWSITTQASH
ncbi:concanavalin A-like lectin/glucanase domain-containing protein [Gorgonomyces haynaldii]|nr:concanavalin A-like lectin/glucanase domain-containing protein [Gorgonomyces haynaldii]